MIFSTLPMQQPFCLMVLLGFLTVPMLRTQLVSTQLTSSHHQIKGSLYFNLLIIIFLKLLEHYIMHEFQQLFGKIVILNLPQQLKSHLIIYNILSFSVNKLSCYPLPSQRQAIICICKQVFCSGTRGTLWMLLHSREAPLDQNPSSNSVGPCPGTDVPASSVQRASFVLIVQKTLMFSA